MNRPHSILPLFFRTACVSYGEKGNEFPRTKEVPNAFDHAEVRAPRGTLPGPDVVRGSLLRLPEMAHHGRRVDGIIAEYHLLDLPHTRKGSEVCYACHSFAE